MHLEMHCKEKRCVAHGEKASYFLRDGPSLRDRQGDDEGATIGALDARTNLHY